MKDSRKHSNKRMRCARRKQTERGRWLFKRSRKQEAESLTPDDRLFHQRHHPLRTHVVQFVEMTIVLHQLQQAQTFHRQSNWHIFVLHKDGIGFLYRILTVAVEQMVEIQWKLRVVMNAHSKQSGAH
jgi:hypothetical protein